MDEIKRVFEVVVPVGLSMSEEETLIEAETDHQIQKFLGDVCPF